MGAGGCTLIPSSVRNSTFCQACQTRVESLLPVPGECRHACFSEDISGRLWTGAALLVTCEVVPNAVRMMKWALQANHGRRISLQVRNSCCVPPGDVLQHMWRLGDRLRENKAEL